MENKMKKKEKGYTIASLKEAMQIAWKSNKTAYVFFIILNVLITGEIGLNLFTTEFILNSAYDLFTGQKELEFIIKAIIILLIGKMLFHILQMVCSLLENRIILDVTYYFENHLNEKLSKIKWDYYESHKTYLQIHEVKSKSLESIKKLIRSATEYIKLVPTIIIISYYLFQINPWIVSIYLVILILFNSISGKQVIKLGKLWDEIHSYSQKEQYFFQMCGDKISHQEFQFHRLFSYVTEKWSKLYNQEYKVRIKIFKNFEITLQTARIIFNIPYIMMLMVVAYETVIGKHEIGFLFMSNSLFNYIIDTVANIQNHISENRVESRFVKLYDEIQELEDEPNYSMEVNKSDIILKDINYKYPQSEQKVLQDLSFSIKRGEKIAVVGVNGSGKTTCMNLLLSLTENYTGSITDGNNTVHLKNAASCILQDFAQYQMTIRENIEVGYIEHIFSDKDILDILEKVGLKEKVEKLERGMDTPLGQLEDGIEFSKGQWQRLAIARLLANPNTTLWILDEPTAYLDPMAEIEIYDLIYQLAGDRSVLFISHRLGFAKRADKIIVFRKGKICEQGTHEELLKKDGIYLTMYRNQEEWYQEKNA